MFYEKQPKRQQEDYKKMLEIVGSLSRLFSNAKQPYLPYRIHENVFAKYFDVKNNARHDDSADAYSEAGVGIGLKTWVGQDNQKVAEFGRLRPEYKHLDGLDLVKKIALYRNKRIKTTMNAHGLKEMLYHIVKRVPHAMRIYEAAFDFIDIDNIEIDSGRGSANNIYFSDGKHTYHFSKSKNTLYMIFSDMVFLDQFDVEIYDDPYDILLNLSKSIKKTTGITTTGITTATPSEPKEMFFITPTEIIKENQLCLRLYSTRPDGTKYVPDKSGLNQWNGARTCYKTDKETGERKLVKVVQRNPNELYIPYPAEDRRRKEFFPPKDTPFELRLPNGDIISAKVCQQDSKAIMSNPNSVLGKWLLRDVFELEEGTPVTYEMLRECNIDSVMFTKEENGSYSVDFSVLGTYEKCYNLEDIEAENDSVED